MDDEAKGLTSSLLGRASNHKLPQEFKSRVLAHIASHYADFGPTLACEKLRDLHGMKVSVETVRSWTAEKRLWIPKVEKSIKIHPLLARRSCVGELIIIDGSIEFWFEDRGLKCVLLVFINDATSNIGQLYFTPIENLEG